MESNILQDIQTYLGDEVSAADVPVLTIILNRAIRNVCNRRYPYGFDDTEQTEVVNRYQNVIFDAAIFYWSKRGAEGQSSHSENGISRSYQEEDSIYATIVPMAKVIT